MLTYNNIACNGTIVVDTEMGEVIQLQGDQRKDVQEFLVDKKEGLGLDSKTIKVFSLRRRVSEYISNTCTGPWILDAPGHARFLPTKQADECPASAMLPSKSYCFAVVEQNNERECLRTLCRFNLPRSIVSSLSYALRCSFILENTPKHRILRAAA